MRTTGAAATAIMMLFVSFGSSACSSTKTSTKAAFCADNIRLDKATANVTSAAGALAAFKANAAVIDDVATQTPGLPDAGIRADAQKLVTAARAAIASGNVNGFFNDSSLSAAGTAVDTYCGVDGSGNLLPADFGAGKTSQLCTDFAPLQAGVQAASSADATLAFIKAHQTDLDHLVTDAAEAPSDIRGDVQALVTNAKAAIAANDPNKLVNQPGTPGQNVGAYCGLNS